MNNNYNEYNHLDQNKFYIKTEVLLKHQIHAHLRDWNKGDDINVFPRKMWIMHNGSRIETRAFLVIEASKDNRDNINKQMIEFSPIEYPNLTYVPFSHVTDVAYQNVMAEIFFQQNIYFHKTAKKTSTEFLMLQKNYYEIGGDYVFSGMDREYYI